METLEVIKREITNKIEDDLRKRDDFLRDPLGHSIYLFFLSKNRIRSPEVENLAGWLNSWVDNIINQRNFTRFVDREFSSAFLAYFTLKESRRLRTKIKVDDVKQLLSEYVEDKRFFNDFTLSVIILLASSKLKDEIKSYPEVLEWVKNEVDRKIAFNDAKNLVLCSILFERLDSQDYLKKLVNYCWGRLLENNIRYHDELYYSWVLWKFKELMGENDLPRIREFTDESLRNARRFLRKQIEDQSIEEVFGADIKAISSRISVSKIFLSAYFDLLIDFSQKTIRVAKEELSRKEIPVWIRLGSLISATIFALDTAILWASFQWNLIRKVSIDVSNVTLFIGSASQFAVNVLIFLIIAVLGALSISLFFDIAYKACSNPKVIKANLKDRMGKLIVWKILISILLGLFKGYFG